MKLAYRGIEYDYNPPMLEVTNSEVACQYRGQATQYTYVRHVPIPQPAERLTYRGVAYQTTRQGGIQQLDMQQATQAKARLGGATLVSLRQKLAGKSTAAQARRQLLQESSQLHQENIARSLQHRMDVAQAQGNEALLQQLKFERQQSRV